MDVGRVVLTADQVLHNGDVVSRSEGFETTATRACQ